MADRDDATQDPTAGRIRRAEQTGQFARSRELAIAITWLGGLALLATFGSTLWQAMQQFGTQSWSSADVSLSAKEWLGSSTTGASSVFWNGLLPILAGVAGIAVLAWSAQSGFRLFPNLASPDLARINPRRNLGNIFGKENLISVMLGLGKFVALLCVAGWVLSGDWQTLASFGQGSLGTQGAAMTEWLTSAIQRLCIAAVGVGVLDYGIRWQLNRLSLRMSDQEVRDEQRAMEASPEVSSRRRMRRG